MRRLLVTLGVVLAIGAGAAAQSAVTTYFGPYTDEELPPVPCETSGAPAALMVGGLVNLIYQCTDGRTIKRQFEIQIEQPMPPMPAPLVSCPASNHRACRCLPAGSYSSDWLSTIGCGR